MRNTGAVGRAGEAIFTLGHARAALVFATTVLLGVGIEASVDGESHRAVTYFVWYGVSAVLVGAVIYLTVLIERRKAGLSNPSLPSPPEVTPPGNFAPSSKELASAPPEADSPVSTTALSPNPVPTSEEPSTSSARAPVAQTKPGGSSGWAALLNWLPVLALAADISLRPKLQERLREGQALLERAGLVPAPTAEHIASWEAEVKYLLRNDEDKLALFLYDPEAGTARRFSLQPDWRRLRRRLEQLEKVIDS